LAMVMWFQGRPVIWSLQTKQNGTAPASFSSLSQSVIVVRSASVGRCGTEPAVLS
jgi:hypothetical protein